MVYPKIGDSIPNRNIRPSISRTHIIDSSPSNCQTDIGDEDELCIARSKVRTIWIHVTSFELVFLNDGAVFVSSRVGVTAHLFLFFEPGVPDSAH